MTNQLWTIDPAHTEVGFGVRHLMISTVKGRFADVKGVVEFADGRNRSSTSPSESRASTPARTSAMHTCARKTSSMPISIPKFVS